VLYDKRGASRSKGQAVHSHIKAKGGSESPLHTGQQVLSAATFEGKESQQGKEKRKIGTVSWASMCQS